jgi:rhomboid family GlyGly-CTERM serine protease
MLVIKSDSNSKMLIKNKIKENIIPLTLTLITLLIMLGQPHSIEWFRYQAVEVSYGQIWRILTANLCHSNWNHWLLNILGLWLMDLFYQPVLSIKLRASLLLFCSLLNVLLLHMVMDIGWYVGLSGALHGYLVGGALLSWSSAKRLNLAIILVVISKLIIELFWQINEATEELIGANVVEEAHSFGAVSAVIFFTLVFLIGNLKKGD